MLSRLLVESTIANNAVTNDFWFHDLRHSFATRAGCDPSVAIPALGATLGRKNWQTTMGMHVRPMTLNARLSRFRRKWVELIRSQNGHKIESGRQVPTRNLLQELVAADGLEPSTLGL